MSGRVAGGFERTGAMALFVAGAAMVVLAVVAESAETVAVALVGFGSTLMALGVLLPRLVGQLRLSAQGLEGELAAVVRAEARASGLSGEATQRAVEIVQSETETAVSQWVAEVVNRVAEEAPEGTAIEIDLERFEEAMRDPIVQALVADGQRSAAKARVVRSTES